MIYTLSEKIPYPPKDHPDFARKIDEELLQWKTESNHRPLLIKGLRQIGKTYALLKFGDHHYSSVVYLDFRSSPELGDIFGSYDIEKIKTVLRFHLPGVEFVEGKTLLIFDEIQDCPLARGSLKYFALDGRYDVIASGSMLGIKGYVPAKEEGSVSVGFETPKIMHPMDFEEFLWAYGIGQDLTEELHEHVRNMSSIDAGVHEQLLRLFRLYIAVGGLPDAVAAYLASKDFTRVREKQTSLLLSYESDFGRRLPQKGREQISASEQAKIQAVFASLPSQLANGNSKFLYSFIKDQRANGEKYRGPIEWLVDYGIVQRSYGLSKIDTLQSGYILPNSFKLFYADTGLFLAASDLALTKAVITNDFDTFKGCVYENIIADGFSKADRPLYFFEPNSHAEIDFVTTYQGKIALVEAKANRGGTPSSRAVLDKFDRPDEIMILRFTAKNIGMADRVANIPYYLVSFLEKETLDSALLNSLVPSSQELASSLAKTK